MASHFKCNLSSEKKRYVCMHVSSYSHIQCIYSRTATIWGVASIQIDIIIADSCCK